jgi:hypothetical protein
MRENLFIIGLVFASFVLQSCNPATPEIVQSQIKTETSALPQVNKTPPKQKSKVHLESGNVVFKGVSFNCNSKIFDKIEAAEFDEFPLEDETHKADYVHPPYLKFYIYNVKQKQAAYLSVYPVKNYRQMYAISEEHQKGFDEAINDLKNVIKDKNFRQNDEITYLPYYDASQSFQAKVKHFPFEDGKRILYLTHWDIGYMLVGNGNLEYIFQGLTNNEKYCVVAGLYVNVDFFPNDSPEGFEGYKIPLRQLEDEIEVKRRKEYHAKIAKRLENLKPNEF